MWLESLSIKEQRVNVKIEKNRGSSPSLTAREAEAPRVSGVFCFSRSGESIVFSRINPISHAVGENKRIP